MMEVSALEFDMAYAVATALAGVAWFLYRRGSNAYSEINQLRDRVTTLEANEKAQNAEVKLMREEIGVMRAESTEQHKALSKQVHRIELLLAKRGHVVDES